MLVKLARQKEETSTLRARVSKWDEVLACYLMTGNRAICCVVVALIFPLYESSLKNS